LPLNSSIKIRNTSYLCYNLLQCNIILFQNFRLSGLLDVSSWNPIFLKFNVCVFRLPTFCLTLNNCIEHYQALLTLLRLVMSKWSQVQYVKGATRLKKCEKTIANDTYDLHIFVPKIKSMKPYSQNYTESLQLHR